MKTKQNISNEPSTTIPGMTAWDFWRACDVRRRPRRLWTSEMRLAADVVEVFELNNLHAYFFDSCIGQIGLAAVSAQEARYQALAILSAIALSGGRYDYAAFRPVEESTHGV